MKNNKLNKVYAMFLLIFLSVPFLFYKPVTVHSEQTMSYDKFKQMAINASNEKGIYTSVMLAQYFLESGAKEVNGQIALSTLSASPNHNMFGIKGEYKGQSVSMETLEDDGKGGKYTITAKFRKYPDHMASFNDNAELLKIQPGLNKKVASGMLKGNETHLYSCAWKEFADTYKEAIDCLEGSYATDTKYASLLESIILDRNLLELDGQKSNGSGSKSDESSYVGDSGWKNKLINFENNVYNETFKGLEVGSDGFINTAFIVGMNNLSETTLKYAYIIMMFITTGIFLFMFTATIIYLVVLPNGLGGQKFANTFTKVTKIDTDYSTKGKMDIISRLGIVTVLVACLYANVIPTLIVSLLDIAIFFLKLF